MFEVLKPEHIVVIGDAFTGTTRLLLLVIAAPWELYDLVLHALQCGDIVVDLHEDADGKRHQCI